MSPITLGEASTLRARLPAAASDGTTRLGELNQVTLTREVDFVTKTEDGVYTVAGFVKEEAETIEGIAKNVEKFSTVIEDNVDKVQTFVQQVHFTTESMEADVNQAKSLLDGSFRTNQAAPKPEVADDFLRFGWGWNVFRIFLVVLTFVVVLLQNMGNVNLKLFEHESAQQDTGGSSKTSIFTAFNMLVINLGPIMRVLSFVRSILTREEKIFAKVEENVDAAARDVKKTVKTVAEVAQVVEKISERVEEDSEQVQTFIRKTKVTSTTTEEA